MIFIVFIFLEALDAIKVMLLAIVASFMILQVDKALCFTQPLEAPDLNFNAISVT